MSQVSIPLTRGLVTQVSPEDAERVLAHNWYARPAGYTSYAVGRVGGKQTYLHRFLTGATGRFVFVDHIDRDGLNNTRSNLRLCTPAQNNANNRKRASRTGRCGVRVTDGGCWQAQIGRAGKLLFLGSFATEREACIAYDSAFYVINGFRYEP